MADVEELAKRLETLEAEVRDLKQAERLSVVSANRLWDEAVATRRGFISLRMQIDDVRNELKSEIATRTNFLDQKFTALFEGQARRFAELEAKFDALPGIIAEMITRRNNGSQE